MIDYPTNLADYLEEFKKTSEKDFIRNEYCPGKPYDAVYKPHCFCRSIGDNKLMCCCCGQVLDR